MDAIETAKEKMGKTIAVLHRELSSLRGRQTQRAGAGSHNG